MRTGVTLAIVATLALVATLTFTIVTHHGARGGSSDDAGPFCSATVQGHTVELSVEEAQNAALITAVAVQRGLPARAVSIALATAIQESGLLNLPYGDRDSVGLFQQRPSQGWGTKAQIMDPVYSTNAFYDALVKVGGYQSLDITVAAQAVQRSGFPEAYADHEPEARALASTLTGNSPAGFTCHLPSRGRVGSSEQTRDQAARVFGASARLATPSGVDVSVAGRTRGWAVASYFVANAAALGLSDVAYDGRTWTRRGGWTDTPAIGGATVHLQPTT